MTTTSKTEARAFDYLVDGEHLTTASQVLPYLEAKLARQGSLSQTDRANLRAARKLAGLASAATVTLEETQRRELAATIAAQAQAIADGTVTGPQWAAARRLLGNAGTLMAWTDDDRS